MREFKTSDAYRPTGDQPTAIATLSEGLDGGERYQTLVGATGTGKTATIAWTIEQVGKPALVIAHNKTLAAQLCNEFREFFPYNAVEHVTHFDPLTGEILAKLDNIAIWPATEYVTSKPTVERAVGEIRHELEERLKELELEGKMLEAHRLRQRTEYDLEMMQELGFCNGIENYSRILEGRGPGTHPFTLLDYFPQDFVVFVDESHQTVPQIGGMYEGDRSRKQTLVDYGFRLPSALDNRPLRFDEFLEKVPQLVFVSATPGPFQLRHAKRLAG